MIRSLILGLAGSALLVGCGPYVKPDEAGEGVRVALAEQVVGCKRLGEVTTTVPAKLVGVNRDPEKVRQELNNLARNEGAAMGGDAVVAESEVTDGHRRYGVFRCR